MIKCILITFLLALLLNFSDAYGQTIIAHRGASYLAPENTLIAVKKGFDSAADAVEVDIHLSKDHRLMVIHDKTTKRTSGKNLAVRKTNASKLRELEVGSWKDPEYRGEKIPYLEEVLELVPSNKKLFIEIKSNAQTVPYLKKTIAKSGVSPARLIIISFDKEAIIAAKQQIPDIAAYWLLHSFLLHSTDNAIEIVRKNHLDGLNVNYKIVNKSLMEKILEYNLDLFVYTVNDPQVASKLLEMGVKGVTTDRPDYLHNHLQ